MFSKAERRFQNLLRFFFFLAFISSLSFRAHAEFQIPDKPDGYITDKAGVLSAQSRAEIESVLRSYEAQTSNQIVAAVFKTLDGSSIEDVSIRMAEKWQPGQKERDNGVLFSVFIEDRQMRIEVGYGLEGVLTDLLCAEIIRNEVAPYFQSGDFDSGIRAGLKAIMDAARGEYEPMAPRIQENNGDAFRIFFIIAAVIFAVDWLRYRFYLKGNLSRGRYGFWEWFFMFAILWFIVRLFLEATLRSGGRWSSGGGGGGGGFSGGGGSFGGGGASGRW